MDIILTVLFSVNIIKSDKGKLSERVGRKVVSLKV